MAHFTETQAQSSSLMSCRKEFIDGSFGYWVLRVSGSDGQQHQFVVFPVFLNLLALSFFDLQGKQVHH